MIGKVVEYIIDAGFDVYIYQREGMLVFRISKMVGKDMCAVDFVLTSYELEHMHEPRLMIDGCERRLHLLRQAIQEKESGQQQVANSGGQQ